jgi:hypothetical protein
MKAKEAADLLRGRLRQLESGKCRILSEGDYCDCNLCLVDGLFFYIFQLEKAKE